MCAFSAEIARGMHALSWLATLPPHAAHTSPTEVAALRRLGSVDGLRISGDLPELHLDLQINHEAGRALVSLVAAGHTWSCFRNIATIESQPKPRGSA